MKVRVSLLLSVVALIFFLVFLFIINDYLMSHEGWGGILGYGGFQFIGIVTLLVAILASIIEEKSGAK